MTTAMLDLSSPELLNQSSLPFRDARGCKAWLASLPLTDVARSHAAMADTIDRLNLTRMPGYERLKVLELMRDKVAFLQESVIGVFAGKPLPMSNRMLDVWEAASSLWQGMEQGYRYCLRAAANEDAETARHFALIVERCLRYTGRHMLNHSFVHGEVPARLYQDLHALFQFAEKRGVAYVPVRDGLDGHRGVATPAQAYARALLLDAAGTSMLGLHELIAVDALLKKWVAKVVLSRIQPEGEAGVLRCTDLIGDRGLRAPPGKPVGGDTLLYFDLNTFSDSLRRRIRKLSTGVAWSDLNLPSAFAQVAVGPLLGHVYRLWCEVAPAEPLAAAEAEQCEAVSDFEGFYQSLAGKPFEAPRQNDDLGKYEAQQMAVFGKITSRYATSGAAPITDSGEAWKLEGIAADRIRLRRPTNSKIPLSLQQLLGYKTAGMKALQLAIVSGLRDHNAHGLVVDAAPLGSDFDAVIFRTKDMAFVPALRQQSMDDSSLNLLVAPGTYQAARVVEVRTDVIQMYRLTGLKQRGANYEWVTGEPL